MAKGKKRKPPKNSNYQTGKVKEVSEVSDSKLRKKREKKKRGSVSFLFGIFAAVFYLYFALYLYNGTGDLSSNLAQYLIPGLVCTVVALVLHWKHL